jgi:hypothetical protein
MFQIEKITSQYDAEEDRLHRVASDGQEQTLGLWLTRPLANELIGMLLGELEVHGASPTDEHVRAALQAWEQSAANAQFKPQPPVPSPAAQSGGLVTSVDVVHADGHFAMVFTLRGDRSASITMDSTRMRQWLGIVHRLYGKAEWPCHSLWPDWITGETQLLTADVSGGILH